MNLSNISKILVPCTFIIYFLLFSSVASFADESTPTSKQNGLTNIIDFFANVYEKQLFKPEPASLAASPIKQLFTTASLPEPAPELILTEYTRQLYIPTPISAQIKTPPLNMAMTYAAYAAANAVKLNANRLLEQHTRDVYYEAKLDKKDLDYTVFKYALAGMYNLKAQGKIRANNHILTVIDYRKHCNKKRMYVVDVKRKKLIHHSLVAHGMKTGVAYAKRFSNKPETHKTSLGFFRASNTYQGQHGYSLRLDGLEYGFNHKARERAIVIHGAEYVSREFIRRHGRIGRSWGCPSLPMETHTSIINTIRNGSLIFAYYDDRNYLSNSNNLDFTKAAKQYVKTGM